MLFGGGFSIIFPKPYSNVVSPDLLHRREKLNILPDFTSKGNMTTIVIQKFISYLRAFKVFRALS